MKVLLVNDFMLDSSIGGAEANMARLVDVIHAEGHTVDVVGFRIDEQHGTMSISPIELDDCDHDFLILGSITNVHPVYVARLTQLFKGRYICWCHDVPWCLTRDLKCGGSYRAECQGCRRGYYWYLYEGAKCVFCYSPMQQEIIDTVFEGYPKTKVLPMLCEQPEKFYAAREISRHGRCAIVGRFAKRVQAYMFCKRNQELDIRIAAQLPKDAEIAFDELPNVTMHGYVENDEMPAFYSLCEYFFHQPTYPDTGPRVLLEARLAGCKLLVHGGLGYLSHEEWKLPDGELVELLGTAYQRAWEAMQNV